TVKRWDFKKDGKHYISSHAIVPSEWLNINSTFRSCVEHKAVLRKKAMQSHAAISSSQYSWCSPPRTSLVLIREAAANSCRLSFGLGNGFLLRMPGPKLECGRP